MEELLSCVCGPDSAASCKPELAGDEGSFLLLHPKCPLLFPPPPCDGAFFVSAFQRSARRPLSTRSTLLVLCKLFRC